MMWLLGLNIMTKTTTTVLDEDIDFDFMDLAIFAQNWLK
jgi:hypothetical protein